jgi:6-phosphogluconolactonase
MTAGPGRVILPGPEAVAREAADRILKIAGDVLRERNEFRLALSGGSTPRRLYEILAGDPFRNRIPWSRVQFFWGDERCVGPDHEDSNYRMAREALLGRIAVPEFNIHRLRGESPDPEGAAREYETAIRNQFGLGPDAPPPAFDVVLLGMGADGHTASLFPGTDGLRETKRWVIANVVPKLKTTRLTLTPAILNRAVRVIFMVAGADKAKALAEVLEGPFEPERLPSQLIRPESGNLVWLLDEAAAAGLKKSEV